MTTARKHWANARRPSAVAAIGLVLSIVSSRAGAQDKGASEWPCWRGPERSGHAADRGDWPSDLKKLDRRWRIELGPSYSGPVVSLKAVFVTESIDARDEAVRALDRGTGRELWRTTWPGAMKVPFFAKKNGDWIRSTPAFDGESLFVGGMCDALVCLDAGSGSQRWRIDFPDVADTSQPAFGFVSSPLVDGEFLYVQAGAALTKLEKKTGKIVWQALKDEGGMESAFSSPVIAALHGQRQLVVQMRQKLAGVDIETGSVLWSVVVPSFRGMNILTPTPFGNGVLTSSHKNRTYFYEIERSGAGWSVKEAWSLNGQGYMSSPVVIGGHAYLHLGNGRLSCIDLREKRETWRTTPFGEYWSMAALRDRILSLDARGELLLIAADPGEFKLLDRRTVADSEAWAHVAVAGNQVFVRDLNGVSMFAWN